VSAEHVGAFVLRCLQVRYLKVIEKSGYQALPWVRYITTAGNYEIRMN
jgi:AP-1 complex subunit mu